MSRQPRADSTADEVLAGRNLSGYQALITGVSSGLGLETARALLFHGADVTGLARNPEKAQAEIRQYDTTPPHGGTFNAVECDLASFTSVRRCVEGLMHRAKPFDLVLANAGVMGCGFSLTVDGFETQFATNHLGHFLLVNGLVHLLRAGSRVICVASAGHRYADVDLNDPNFERTSYDPFVAYGRSKTANILFAVELDRRLRSKRIRAGAVHPGVIRTNLGRHLPGDALTRFVEKTNAELAAQGKPPFALKSIPQGAATGVWAGLVADAEAIGGRYCENCHVTQRVTLEAIDPISEGVRPYALDPFRAAELWAKSESMVGQRFFA